MSESGRLNLNVICILMDSMNRHFLPAYGNDWVLTPNLQRLQQRGVTFDRCFIGSMPCMPARRDLWTGVQEFLWRPWGSLEPFDQPLPRTLKADGVFTGLVSDHYHLWERGRELPRRLRELGVYPRARERPVGGRFHTGC